MQKRVDLQGESKQRVPRKSRKKTRKRNPPPTRTSKLEALEQRIVLNGGSITDFQRESLRDGLAGFEQWLNSPDVPSGLDTTLPFLIDATSGGSPTLANAIDLPELVRQYLGDATNQYFDATADALESSPGLAASIGATDVSEDGTLSFRVPISIDQDLEFQFASGNAFADSDIHATNLDSAGTIIVETRGQFDLEIGVLNLDAASAEEAFYIRPIQWSWAYSFSEDDVEIDARLGSLDVQMQMESIDGAIDVSLGVQGITPDSEGRLRLADLVDTGFDESATVTTISSTPVSAEFSVSTDTTTANIPGMSLSGTTALWGALAFGDDTFQTTFAGGGQQIVDSVRRIAPSDLQNSLSDFGDWIGQAARKTLFDTPLPHSTDLALSDVIRFDDVIRTEVIAPVFESGVEIESYQSFFNALANQLSVPISSLNPTYTSWNHELRFEVPVGGGTLATQQSQFQLPAQLGPLTSLVGTGTNTSDGQFSELTLDVVVDLSPFTLTQVGSVALPENGILSADAEFDIGFNIADPVRIVIPVDPSNTGRNDLVDDVTDALSAAQISGLTVSLIDDRMVWSASSTVAPPLIVMTADPDNTSVTELGIAERPSEVPATVVTLAPLPANGVLTGDADFDIVVNGEAPASISVLQSATQDNFLPRDLVDDMNMAFSAASVPVSAELFGDSLRLTTDDAGYDTSIEITSLPGSVAETELGFTNETTSLPHLAMTIAISAIDDRVQFNGLNWSATAEQTFSGIAANGNYSIIDVTTAEGTGTGSVSASFNYQPTESLSTSDLFALLEGSSVPWTSNINGESEFTLPIEVVDEIVSLTGNDPEITVGDSDLFSPGPETVQYNDLDELRFFENVTPVHIHDATTIAVDFLQSVDQSSRLARDVTFTRDTYSDLVNVSRGASLAADALLLAENYSLQEVLPVLADAFEVPLQNVSWAFASNDDLRFTVVYPQESRQVDTDFLVPLNSYSESTAEVANRLDGINSVRGDGDLQIPVSITETKELVFGLDLYSTAAPNPYLHTDSDLAIEFEIDQSNWSFDGQAGIIPVGIDGASVSVGNGVGGPARFDFGLAPRIDHKWRSNQVNAFSLSSSGDAFASATIPIAYPRGDDALSDALEISQGSVTATPQIDDAPDLNSIAGTIDATADMPMVPDRVRDFFDELSMAVSTTTLTAPLPMIGTGLLEINPFGDIGETIATAIESEFAGGDRSSDAVNRALGSLVPPGPPAGTLPALDSGVAQQSVAALTCLPSGPTLSGAPGVSLGCVDLGLLPAIPFPVNIPFPTGIPGFTSSAPVVATLNVSVKLNFIVGYMTTGDIWIEASRPDDITINLISLNLPAGPINGSMGEMAMSVTDAGSNLTGSIVVDLADDPPTGNGDGFLTNTEISLPAGIVGATPAATAKNLSAAIAADPSVINSFGAVDEATITLNPVTAFSFTASSPGSTSAALSGAISVTFDTTTYSSNGVPNFDDLIDSINGRKAVIVFTDLQLNVSAAIDDFMTPDLEKMQTFADLYEKALDDLNQPLFEGSTDEKHWMRVLFGDIRLFDLLPLDSKIEIDELKQLIDAILAVKTTAVENGVDPTISVPIGSFTYNTNNFDVFQDPVISGPACAALGGTESSLPEFVADGSCNDPNWITVQLTGGPPGVTDFNDAAGDFAVQLNGIPQADGTTLSFSILRNQHGFDQLLLGRPATIMQFDAPRFAFTVSLNRSRHFELSQLLPIFRATVISSSIPLVGPLLATATLTAGALASRISGEFSFDVDLGVGQQNIGGTFIHADRSQTRFDVDGEVTFDIKSIKTSLPFTDYIEKRVEKTFGKWAAKVVKWVTETVEVTSNLGANFGVRGGKRFSGEIFLKDPDGDGKVFVSDYPEGFLACAVDTRGTERFIVDGFYDLGPFGSGTVPLLSVPSGTGLWDQFDSKLREALPDCTDIQDPPVLATLDPDGTLQLNIGPRASMRLSGNTDDIDEEVEVEAKFAGFAIVRGFGFEQVVGDGTIPITRIVGDGGAGNDKITITGELPIPAILSGGSGDDEINGFGGNDELDGGSGKDVIRGGAGRDTIRGGSNNDTLYGDAGIDIIDGDSGRDLIFGGADGDVLSGGTGNDEIRGGDGNDSIDGGSHDDSLFGDDGEDTIEGQSGADKINGGNQDDTLRGGDGNDEIDGGGGDDRLEGGVGHDVLVGGNDNDTLIGGDGNDNLQGQSGNDLLEGFGGADYLSGGSGNDRLFGYAELQFSTDLGDILDVGTGNDVAYGRGGDDEIRATSGTNLLDGGDGNDLILGGTDSDEIRGGTGEDIIYAGAGMDIVDGGTHDDFIHGQSGVDELSGGAGDDILFGGSGGDTVNGGAGVDILRGGSGDDTLHGHGTADPDDNADDELFGDSNDDELYGGGGSDVLFGGTGDDVAAGGAGDDRLFGGPGDDELSGEEGEDGAFGGSGSDTIDGGDNDDLLEGGDGNDQIEGGSGNDTIRGQLDDDRLIGGDGDDHVYGGPGSDNLLGGIGDDLLSGEEGDDAIEGGFGIDDIDGGADDDWVDGGAGADVISGGTGFDELRGGAGDDSVTGGDDDDRVFGGTGDDTVTGDDGDDIVDGGDGSDLIEGGLGNDLLRGGGGVGDIIRGGDGDDQITGSDQGAASDPDFSDMTFFGDLIDAGPGDDIVRSLGGADRVIGGLGRDVIDAGSGADYVTGDDGDDEIDLGAGNGDQGYGGPGDDTIYGSLLGDDLIVGDLGDDRLFGRGGEDELQGGPGNDLIDGGTGADLIHGGDGDDELLGGGGTGDQLLGGAGNDIIRGSSDGADVADGGDGKDFLFGNAGNDTLRGGPGDDVIRGGQGDDLIEGGIGSDTLLGEADHDTLYGHTVAGTSDDSAVDFVYGDFGIGSVGLSVATTIGLPGRDRLFGGGGNDLLFGEAEDDFIDSGSGTGDTVDFGSGESAVATDFVPPSTTPDPSIDAVPLPLNHAATLPSGRDDRGRWNGVGGSYSADGISGRVSQAIESSLAVDGDTRYVAWVDDRSGVFQIYVARHTPDDGWGALDGSAGYGGISDTALPSRTPSIAVDASGHLVVTWMEGDQAGQNVHALRWNTSTDAWETLNGAADSQVSTNGQASDPTVVVTTEQTVLLWVDSSTGFRDLMAMRYDQSENGWAGIDGSDNGFGLCLTTNVLDYSVAVNGSEIAIALTRGSDGESDIHIKSFNGTQWSDLSPSGDGGISESVQSASQASIAYHQGEIFVAWRDELDAGEFGADVYVKRWTGAVWEDAGSASAEARGVSRQKTVWRGDVRHPKLSSNVGELYLSWIDQDATGNEGRVFVKAFDGASFEETIPGDASGDGIIRLQDSITEIDSVVDSMGRLWILFNSSADSLGSVGLVTEGGTSGNVYFTGPGTSVADILDAQDLESGDRIVVTSSQSDGFTIGSADSGVHVIGAQDVAINGPVVIDSAVDVVLQELTIHGEMTLQNVADSALRNLTVDGSASSVTGGSNLQIVQNRFASPLLLDGSNSTVRLEQNRIASGIRFDGSTTDVTFIDNQVTGGGVEISAATSGVMRDNDVIGTLSVLAPWTGTIESNRFRDSSVGIRYAASAALKDNTIENNTTGVLVETTDPALGFGVINGSDANAISQNTNGVQLSNPGAVVAGQRIFENVTGVMGAGQVGSTEAARASEVFGNVTGVAVDGDVIHSVIRENDIGIKAASSQQISQNVFADNRISIDVASTTSTRVLSNSFIDALEANLKIHSLSSESEIRGNVLSISTGTNIDVAPDSRSGFYSDYNLLHADSTGHLVRYAAVDFDDILNFQKDIRYYDQNSFGSTVIAPVGVEPVFGSELSFGENLMRAAANRRQTAPLTDGSDPILKVDDAVAMNLLTNGDLQDDLTGWTASPTLVSAIDNSIAFVGEQSLQIDASVSGVLSQTLDLLDAGYTSTSIDSGLNDVIASTRVRAGGDLGELSTLRLEVEFLAGDDSSISLLMMDSDAGPERWKQIGDRVAVPPLSRKVVFRVVSDGAGSNAIPESIDDSYLAIISQSHASDLGNRGGLLADAADSQGPRLYLRGPDLYVDWERDVPKTIRWDSFDVPANEPVRIDLLQDTADGPAIISTISPSTANDGEFSWTPISSGIDYGTLGLRLQLSLANDPIVLDRSFEAFSVPEDSVDYFVNDSDQVSDQYTSAVGDHRNTGRVASAPKPSPASIIDTYSLTAGDTLSVDAGDYGMFYPLVISNVPGIGDDEGFILQGAAASTTSLRHVLPATNAPLLELNDADFMTITDLDLSGGQYGIYANSQSESLSAERLTITNSFSDGFYSGSNLLDLDQIVVSGNGGHGIWVQGSVGAVSNVQASDNSGNGLQIGGETVSVNDSVFHDNDGSGLALDAPGTVIVQGNESFRNKNYGFAISSAEAGTIVGSDDLTLLRGNLVYENDYDGIYFTGTGLIAGNTVYGQTSNVGIRSFNDGRIERNVAYGNRIGIDSFGDVIDNRVFENRVGINTAYSSVASGNVIYSSEIGIAGTQTGVFTNNLIYDIDDVAIDLYQPASQLVVRNNTIDTSDADSAIQIRFGNGPEIVNNIFRLENTAAFDLDSSSQLTHRSDYNLFALSGHSTFGDWAGASKSTLPQWQLSSSADAASLVGTASFVDPAGADGVIGAAGTNRGFDDDYHLQSVHGSFRGGFFAPIVDSITGLPVLPTVTLENDSVSSVAIDRGDNVIPVGDEPANNGGFINLGAFGGTAFASKSPEDFLLITDPAASRDWPAGQSFDISWRTSQSAGTVDVLLIPLAGGDSVTIADDTANDGQFTYTVEGSLDPGDYHVRVQASGGVTGDSAQPITVLGEVTAYYVNLSNDATLADNQYTTAAGNSSASGTTPSDPMPSLKQVIDTYDLEPGDVIFVDSGEYSIDSNILIGTSDSGVRITGPTDVGKSAIFNRDNTATGAYVFELVGTDDVTIENLGITGGNSGVMLAHGTNNASTTISSNDLFGNETGIYVGSGHSGVQIENNDIHDNTNYGSELHDTQVVVSDNRVYANHWGITAHYAPEDTSDRRIIGNEVYANTNYGIYLYGNNAIAEDNAVYGHQNGDGISVNWGATAKGNSVYANKNGIYVIGTETVVQSNRIFANDFGVYGPHSYDSQIIENSIYSNSHGIRLDASTNYSTIASNLIYDNTNAAVSINGGQDGMQLTGNTIQQEAGDAISLTSSADVEVTNNILSVSGGAAINVAGDAQSGFSSDYNLFSISDTGVAGRWGGRELADHATWMFELGLDSNGLAADPMWIDIDGLDNRLGFSDEIVSTQIVDDGDTDFSTTGIWTTNATGGYAGDYQQGSYSAPGTATWTFTGLTPGSTYRLGVTYPRFYYSIARYEISDESGSFLSVRKDQYSDIVDDFTVDSEPWGFLGIFDAKGTTLTVTMHDEGGSQYAYADAIRLDELVGDHGADDDFHLANGSPAIDRGNPVSIHFREPAPSGDRVNLGAYGNTSEATPSDSQTVQIASPNGLEKWTAGETETIHFQSSGLTTYRTSVLLNAGGDTVSYWSGNDYLVSGWTGTPSTAVDLSAVSSPAPQQVYQSYLRSSSYIEPLEYEIPLPAGNYQVRLHFVATNEAYFDLSIQGEVVESEIDPDVQAGGANRALIKEFTATVTGDEGLAIRMDSLNTWFPEGLAGVQISQANPNGSPAPTASIDVSNDSGTNWTEIATGVPIDEFGRGRFDWTIPESFITPSALARVRSGSVSDTSFSEFLIAPAGNEFYVNIPGDTDFADNQYTTAAGDNTADGKSPGTPMASLGALINAYELDSGDVVYVDSGNYFPFGNIVIGTSDSGVRITGPTDVGKSAIFNRDNTATGAYVFELVGTDDVTIENLGITGGNSGVMLAHGTNNASTTISSNDLFGNETGIYVGSGHSGVQIENNDIHDNTNYGSELHDTQVVVSDNRVYANHWGITAHYAPEDTSDRRIIGNEVYANTNYGIYLYGNNAIAEDNAVYGHQNGDGISVNWGATAKGNSVYANKNGIYVIGTETVVQSNRIFANDFGVYGPHSYDSQIIENSIYSNSHGIRLDASTNYSTIASNLIYDNTNAAVSINGGQDGMQLTGNTIQQEAGDAISLTSSADVEVTNNILSVSGGAAINVAGDAQSGFSSDYNLFSISDTGVAGRWGGRELADHATWMFELGLDSNGLAADPMWIDIDGLDNRLGFSDEIVSTQIVDDGDTDFSTTGIWTTNATGGYAGDYQQGSYSAPGTATWTFTGLTPGSTYRLGVTYPRFYYSIARYEISDESGSFLSVRKDQYSDIVDDFTVDSEPWGFLGIFDAKGTTLTVTMHDEGGSQYAYADAIRLDELVGDHGADDDFHLANGSPAIDRGNPVSIHFREPAPSGDRVNLGAYGNTSEATPSDSQTVQIASPNGLEKWTAGETETIHFQSSGLTTYRTSVLLNAGGDTVSYWSGNDYLVSGWTGTPSTAVDLSAVSSPAPQQVYQSYLRSSSYIEPLEYEIPLPAGNYQVRLHFVATNEAYFDLSIQGEVVESEIDPDVQAGGANRALIKEFTATVTGDEGLAIRMDSLNTWFPEGLAGVQISQANPNGSPAPTASIDVSNDSGTNWTEIATGVPIDEFGRGRFDWTIPESFITPSALARVRSGSVSDTSFSEFLIAPAGNEFYVNIPGDTDFADNQYTTAAGDNTADGKSPGTPMASLGALINAYELDSGDVVYVDSGNYFPFGNIVIGTSDSGVRVTGPTDVGKSAIFDRGNTATGAYVFELVGTNDVTIENLGITGGHRGVMLADAANNVGTTISSNDLFGNEMGIYVANGNTDMLIENNEVHDNTYDGIGLYGGQVVARDNRVYANQWGFTAYYTPDNTTDRQIIGNEVYANTTGGIYVYGTGSVAEDNVVYSHRDGDGISVNWGATARGNQVYANTRGIRVDGVDNEIESNRIFGNGFGIDGAYSYDSQVIGNSIYSNSEGIHFYQSSNYSTIASNLIYDNTNAAVSINGGSDGMRLIGNTIHQEVGDAVALTNSADVEIKNNIMWVDNGSALQIASNAVNGLDSDYNVVNVGTGTSAVYGVYAGTAAPDLVAWQNATGGALNSVNGDPLLLDTDGIDNVLGYDGGVDYSQDDNWALRKNSPAIDSGASWLGTTVDYLGSAFVDDIATTNVGSQDYFETQTNPITYAVTGTAQNRKSVEYWSVDYSLPFSFPLFGESFDAFHVSNQGLIRFGLNYTSSWSSDAAERFATEDATQISPLWQDIHTGGAGDDIYIDDSIPNQVTVHWDATSRLDGGDVKFGVTLFIDGSIDFLYGTTAGLRGIAGLTSSSNQLSRFASTHDAQDQASNTSVGFELRPGITDIGAIEFRGDSGDSVAPSIFQTIPNAVAAGVVTGETVDSIQLQFSEEVNYFDARAFAAYELREAGTNGTFDDGDDTVYELVPDFQVGQSHVDLNLPTASLLSTDPLPPTGAFRQRGTSALEYYLPEGNYQFRLQSDATGSVRDTAGLLTDGDGDGTEGGTYLREFQVFFLPELFSLDLTPGIIEGDAATLSGSFRDLSAATSHTLDIDWGDGTAVQSIALAAGETTFDIKRTFPQDSEGEPGSVFNVSVTLRNDLDRSVPSTSFPLSIAVQNAAPRIDSLVAPAAVDEDETFHLEGTLSDAGPNDTHVLSIDWGDGKPVEEVILNVGERTFSVPHAYSDVPSSINPLDRNVSITVSDGKDTSDLQVKSLQLTTLNTPPLINDQEFSIQEMSDDGTIVGQFANLDPDLVLPNQDTQAFQIIGGTGLGLFQITDEGVISVIDGDVLDHHTQSSYSLVVEAVDGRGQSDVAVATVNVLNVTEVDSVTIADGSAQRSNVSSITVEFDTVVSLAADSIEIETSSGDIFFPAVSTATQNGKTVATLTFSGTHTDLGGSLADGNYVLRILGDKVTSADGAMRGDVVDQFFRFFGDTDGDRDVDGQDYGRFGLTFLKQLADSQYNPALDSDQDGDVDGQDYGRFGLRFLKSLTP